ncbi:NACHT, LRR and PYD domains-containing protein 1b allele 4-like isoform X2 [Onychomys torridus]|uniref:NACHT, LRR and PYD domains-containing protein 1b allele 4-like isoform X2 n=1 Tax=Onychomys torridus TaxID=38674 RepID=UPI00167F303C|nr:NACHT, LRR and PYD domains-containing protein 1b allele 4-like isoform X2 [Onychomys torridus]
MADRDKDPLVSCLEQSQKGDWKLYGQALHSQALSGDPINTGAAQSQKASDREEAQHKGQKGLDPSHHIRKQMDLEMQQPFSLSKKDLMLRCPSLPRSISTSNMKFLELKNTWKLLPADHESRRNFRISMKLDKGEPGDSGSQSKGRPSLLRSISTPNMKVLEWSDDFEPLSTDPDFWRHFQISKKKLDKGEPEDSGSQSKEIHKNEGREKFYHTASWKTKDLLQNFTQLLLLQKPCPRGWETLVWKSWSKGKGEERGHLIEIQDLFNPNPDTQEEPQLVILEGVAGIGKSTLARQVRRAWEEGQLYRDRFQHVFYFSCRELAQCKQLSLAELIAKDQTVPVAPMKKILSQPEKMLFILDGIDEPAWVLEKPNPPLCMHWSQPQPVHTLLGSLLGKSVLPGAFFLLTARTTALQKFIPSLEQPRWVEVLGFSRSGWKKYIFKYFTKKREAIEAFSLINSNPVLLTLCGIPWVSWLVCTCLKQQMEKRGDLSLTSQTTTELCLKYLSQTLPGHALGTHLRRLCSLAAEGILRRRTLFSERDLWKQELSEDVIAPFLNIGVLQKQPSSVSYSFSHLCLQEFFAAMSCILGNNEQKHGFVETFNIVETLKEVYGRHDLFEAPTVRFLFGLLSKKGMRKMQKIFACRFPWDTIYLQLKIREEALYHQPHSLGLLHCLYEIQDKELLTDVMDNYQVTSVPAPVDMVHPEFHRNLVVQTDVELMVVTFCIKFCSYVNGLQLNPGAQEEKVLLAPRMVLSRWTPITNESWQILFSTLEFTGNLKFLDLSGNPLNNYALCSLCRTLRSPGCHLRTLWLINCGLTFRHCADLASVLRVSSSLTELDLQLNNLGDDGVRLLCEALRNPYCNLRILWLDQAALSDQVMMELKAVEAKNPQLLISSIWKPHVMDPTKNLYGEEMGDSPTSFKDQRLQSEEWYSQLAPLKTFDSSPPDSPRYKHLEPLETEDDFWGPTGPVATEVVDRERNLYRVQFPVPGSYHCPNTGLRFVVTRAVTIEIGFCAWSQYLDETPLQHSHMVAGPLFDIKAEQGAVAAVHLPHFVALQGDLRPVPPMIPAGHKAAPALLHFLDEHREQLVARVTSVDPLLDKLHNLVLNEEEYESVRAEATNQNKMRKLFSLSRSWSWDSKEQVYRALKDTHPHLIMDLYETSRIVSERS